MTAFIHNEYYLNIFFLIVLQAENDCQTTEKTENAENAGQECQTLFARSICVNKFNIQVSVIYYGIQFKHSLLLGYSLFVHINAI